MRDTCLWRLACAWKFVPLARSVLTIHFPSGKTSPREIRGHVPGQWGFEQLRVQPPLSATLPVPERVHHLSLVSHPALVPTGRLFSFSGLDSEALWGTLDLNLNTNQHSSHGYILPHSAGARCPMRTGSWSRR